MKYILFFCLLSFGLYAQTGIGTTTPDASAKLDVSSTNKGFLPPRVTLTSTTDASTIASPAEGLLVYNLGSVGLQAGYYYWNGANWATIATATSAGNGVTAMDLVKLYGEAFSIAAGKIGNASGYSFTVPVSGRYLFDFTSSGYASGDFTMTFKVRQGTTDLATDAQTSSNNSVHVEYNGKVELNLQAGATYNVIVTSTGTRNSSDYDRVYYKLVAGNLPVTGQSVDYVSVMLTTDQSNSTAGQNVKFQTIQAGNIPYDASTGNFSLTAGKTYRLFALASLNGTSPAGSALDIIWRTADGVNIGPLGSLISANTNINFSGQGVVDYIFTPLTNTTVSLYISFVGNSTTVLRAYATNATITQVGSSAIVNPWILSGTDTYNTTGKVGIGTNSPNASAILDLSSTTKGVLIPRMTAAQKAAISGPTTGLLIYQTDAPSDFYYYNGSSWISLREPNWTSAGTIQSVGWNATTTAPTIGTTAVNDYSYKQIGSKTWKCQLTFSAGSTTGANNGSGDYLFTLPNGLQFNTSLAGQAAISDNVGTSTWVWPSVWLSSSTGSITNLSQGGLLYVVPYSSTQFRLIHVGIAGIGYLIPYSSGYYGVGSNNSWRVTFTFQSL